jgi:hypothetical protein
MDPIVNASLPTGRDAAAVMRGRWHVRASTSRKWLSGARDAPVATFGIATDHPFTLESSLSWITLSGDVRNNVGTSRARGAWFVWSLHGPWYRRSRIRWKLLGVSEDGDIVAVRFNSRFGHSGADVLVRDGVEPRLRGIVSTDPDRFGLTTEELASLEWLAPTDGR